jgi:acetolactate synthase-1/2/3 large subunit
MSDRTGGQLLVDALARQGVRTIFGIPGVQLDDAVDALYAAAEEIRFVCARNEQATTYMADGYARSTGSPGVAMVVPGPGVLNALSGLATAYSTNSRVLLLAGQIDSRMIGKGYGALHEIPDQTGVLSGLTKWTGTARAAAEIPGLVARAFAELRGGRPRPVALELPPDVLAATVSGTVSIPGLAEPSPVVPDGAAIERAAALLLAAERPLIYVGGGVLAAGSPAGGGTGGAAKALTELAEALEAPVLVSENARGAIDARHRLAFDALALRAFRKDADLVLAVGTRFMTTFGGQIDTGGAQLILLNAEPADLGGPRVPEVAVHADADLGLRALADAVGSPSRPLRSGEFGRVRAWVADSLADVGPQREYLAAIRSALPDDGVFVSEFTQVGYAASMCFPVYHPHGYIGPGYQGTLGYGFATALGAKAADPARAVISVTGDGGFAWTMQELSTARRYGLGLVTVLFNDGHFGNVRRIQKSRYGARYFASDLTNPDYGKLADAFGIAHARARDPESLGGVLRDAVPAGEPILVEVPVGEFPSPWHLIHEGLPRPAPIAPGAHLRAERGQA